MAKKGTIVLDPGHGGSTKPDKWSKPNNATGKISGVLEKTMTLDLARLVRTEIQTQAAAAGHDITVVMTRDADVNPKLDERSAMAANAELFLSIHFNGLERNAPEKKTIRGVVPLVRWFEWIKENGVWMDSQTRLDADEKFAVSVQKAVFDAIKKYDSKTAMGAVQVDEWRVLKRDFLRWKALACLIEIEFIDLEEVDTLFNIGPNKDAVRNDVAKAIATVLIANLP